MIVCDEIVLFLISMQIAVLYGQPHWWWLYWQQWWWVGDQKVLSELFMPAFGTSGHQEIWKHRLRIWDEYLTHSSTPGTSNWGLLGEIYCRYIFIQKKSIKQPFNLQI